MKTVAQNPPEALGRPMSRPLEISSAPDRCKLLEQHPFSLRFKSPAIEAAYLHQVAVSRLPVLVAIAVFDICMFFVRLIVASSMGHAGGISNIPVWAQLRNLAVLYSLLSLFYWRSKKEGATSAQSEVLLGSVVSLVLTLLIIRSVESSSNWVFVAFFLICTTQVLRLRWAVGAALLSVPVAVCAWRNLLVLVSTEPLSLRVSSTGPLAPETIFHLAAAWAVGTLMGYLADSSRREAFASHRLALSAAATELVEVRARVAAEHKLAAAQAVAEARSSMAEREKASIEAKSEFISMLCHEIRTPLNGCLASAEMLLQTELSEDQKELADTVRVSGSILLSTVSNFLDYFKLEAGKQLDVVRAPVDLPSLVGDVQRIIEAMVSNTGDVRLLPPDMALAPAFVLGDPARVCGVLLNLYMNAAKFTRKGAIGMKVHVVRSDYKPSPPTTAVVDVSPSDGSVVDSAWNYSADADAARSGSRSGSGSDGDGDAEGSNGPDSCDGDACAAPGDGGFGYSGSEHDSVQSMVKRHRVGRKMGAQPVPPPYEDTIPRSPGSVRMLVQDEGDGWLSTCSETVPRASCDGRMSISGPAEEVWVCFEVRDSGVGVPPKSLHALFHDYVQGDAADMEQPRTRSGTGLGLAICSKQVAVLGGSIGAVSKPDAGSIFWFKLPMLLVPPEEEAYAGSALAAAAPSLDVKRAIGGGMQPAATDDAGAGAAQQFDTSLENRWQAAPAPDSGIGATTTAPAAPATLPPLGTATGGGASGVAGLRVLVAEDNLINRKVACRVLQSLSVQYEVASNGREAVEAVKAAEASGTVLDAVFMDVCMPEMGGVEATRCIRAMGSTVPFIAMTANAMDKDRDECLAAGMNAFLSKPVLREQLVKCLVATCQGKEPTGSQL